LEYIDHCKTPFGKRQLKRWLLSPLLNITEINQRLDAVEDMIQNQHETDVLRARFSKLPDLEKLLAKIFTYSVKHSVKAIYFEDVNLAKMKDFRTLQLFFKDFANTIDVYTNLKNDLKSERLKLLLTTEDEGGLIPSNIQDAIREFDDLIIWKTVAGPTKI
jgi:DNA mismatch repair ATPase MutS